jgi:hypothetical protein
VFVAVGKVFKFITPKKVTNTTEKNTFFLLVEFVGWYVCVTNVMEAYTMYPPRIRKRNDNVISGKNKSLYNSPFIHNE